METDLINVTNRIIADFELRTGEQADANQVIEALIGSYSGAAHAIYRYIDNRLNQMFPLLADEDWLDLWADRVGITRLEGEIIDTYRIRVEAALQACRRFGTIDDLIAWGLVYDDIRFIYPLPNQPNFGYTTLVLGSDDLLSEIRKTEIRLEIEAQMVAGSRLYVEQSQVQLVDFVIITDMAYQVDIQTVLNILIKDSNAEINAQITIAQIHAQIDTITNNYTLVSPDFKIEALNNNYLEIGLITWP
jgi:hypothetical protein